MKLSVFSLLLALLPAVVLAQRPRAVAPSASFFATYAYLTYSILDKGTSPTPLPAKGVGGTLLLRPDGSYQKRLTLAGNGTTLRFDQDGRFTFSGDHISFVHSDRNGNSRTDEGTFRLRNGLLTITLNGFPAGNQSIYTLQRQ
ncbi:hypothetical protein [Hymenobacter sp. UYP22]|uniref:hypothetical protein n=1 Tax=Hymenobacter sp. UYP22 TaxID=3156348 RepID=UPI0033930CB4